MTISPTSAEPITSARRCAASNGSTVQPSGPARPAASGAAPGQLADLAAELADAERGDRRFMMEAVATDDVDRTFEHQPARRIALAHIVEELAGSELARRAAREALRGLGLRRVEHGKQLVTAGVEERHGASLAGAAAAASPVTRSRQVTGSACRPLLGAATATSGKCLPAIDGVIMELVQAPGDGNRSGRDRNLAS